ncbi:MAG: flagellar hook capping protein [Planctomycetes bacterium]|nr:flagellar hook capping protein [Planctomycetota bacterium]
MTSLNSVSGVQRSSSAGGGPNVDQSQFLNLLVNQLKNQNPLEPVSNDQFITQLAQFQGVQAQQTTNDNLNTLINLNAASATISHLTEASSLLGKKINYQDPSTGDSKTGVVTSVGLNNGTVVANVGDNPIPILLITGIQPNS